MFGNLIKKAKGVLSDVIDATPIHGGRMLKIAELQGYSGGIALITGNLIRQAQRDGLSPGLTEKLRSLYWDALSAQEESRLITPTKNFERADALDEKIQGLFERMTDLQRRVFAEQVAHLSDGFTERTEPSSRACDPQLYQDFLSQLRQAGGFDAGKRLYRNLALQNHPDRAGGTEEANNIFVALSEAYETFKTENGK